MNYNYDLIKREAIAIIDKSLDKNTNICSLLSLIRSEMDLFWVGLYMVDGDLLKLGIFQGLPACTKIKMGQGACGTAAKEAKTIVLEDVSSFPGYIACHSETKSEIVIPAVLNNKVLFVLDADSTEKDRFHKEEEDFLCGIVDIITGLYIEK